MRRHIYKTCFLSCWQDWNLRLLETILLRSFCAYKKNAGIEMVCPVCYNTLENNGYRSFHGYITAGNICVITDNSPGKSRYLRADWRPFGEQAAGEGSGKCSAPKSGRYQISLLQGGQRCEKTVRQLCVRWHRGPKKAA